MGIDVTAFLYLHSFVPAPFTLGSALRACSLDSYRILGLTLHYLNSCMMQKTLCQVFGITPAVCSRLLDGWLHEHVCSQVLVFDPEGLK
jgi:hypothetical protein